MRAAAVPGARTEPSCSHPATSIRSTEFLIPAARRYKSPASVPGRQGSSSVSTVSADARHIIFFVSGQDAGVYVADISTGEASRLVEADTSAVLGPASHLLFIKRGTLYGLRFDQRTATSSKAIRSRWPRRSRSNWARVPSPRRWQAPWRTGRAAG